MKWLKENGRQPKPDDAKLIMSQNLSFTELVKLLGRVLNSFYSE